MGWLAEDPGTLFVRLTIAAFVAAFATFVAIDMVQRAQGGRRRVGLRWVVGMAPGLGTGIWSAQVISLSAIVTSAGLGYQPSGIFGAWVFTALLS